MSGRDSYFDRSESDGRGGYCNQGELAEWLGVTRATIHEWQDGGLPYTVRDDGNGYHMPSVIRWLHRRETGDENESPKDRLARVQADRVELDIAQQRRVLIPSSEVAETWSRIVMTVRAGILNIPPVAHALDATPGVEAKYDLLVSRCNDLLEDLSVAGNAIVSAADDGAVQAAAEDDRSGVGGE